MELLKFLLGVSLIITVKTVTGEMLLLNETVCRKNMQSLTIIDYNVRLTPFLNEDNYKDTDVYRQFESYFDEERAKGNLIFHGVTTMTFRLKEKLNTICLHAKNLQINTFLMAFYGINDTAHEPRFTVPRFTYDKNLQIVGVYFNNFEFSDTYTYRLVIGFGGSITDYIGGFVKIFYTNNKSEKKWSIVAADFQGTGIRQIFPCWDEPDIRSKFNISIKHHRNYTALSNSPFDWAQYPDGDMFHVRTVFKPTSNIPPYRVAIVLSELNRIPNTTVWWCRQEVQEQIKFAIEMATIITLSLKRVFYNVNFPPEVNHVVLPGFHNEGMESWGIILFRETSIMYDEKLDPIVWKFEVIRNLLRKIVHQFDIFDQASWSYLWLHEGLAMFLTMENINEYVQSGGLKDLLVVQFQRESLRLNDHYDMSLTSEVVTPSDINSLFNFAYYVKAPVIVRTLLQRICPCVFVSSLNKFSVMYQDKPKNDSNSTINEFFNILQKIQGSQLNINVTERFSHWTKQKRYPILQVTRKSSENQVKIELSTKFHNTTYPDDLWIYVTYTMQNTPYIRKGVWMNPNQTIINISNIKDNEWIVVNIEQAGYYRVNYDKDNWRKLGSYLNSSEYLNIHVLNRAQIIDDAYYFLLNEKIGFHLFRRLTYYLSKEKNYVAWYPMFKIMEEISGFFPFSQSTKVKEHFRKILDSILEEIGYIDKTKEDDFTKILRQEAVRWACTLNSSQCMTDIVYDPEWIYNMPKKEKPGWIEYINCNGMMTPNTTTSNNVWNSEMSNNNLLKFLACSENHKVIIHVRVLENFYKCKISIFHSIIARHAKNNLVLNYLLENFRNIIPSEIKITVAITNIINYVYTQDQLVRVIIWAENNFSNPILIYILQRINKRLLEIEKHTEYFNRFL